MEQIKELVNLLVEAGLPFKFQLFLDGYQVLLYNSKGGEIDDAVWNQYSHGHDVGLLETYKLGDCCGYETADEIARGWCEMYHNHN